MDENQLDIIAIRGLFGEYDVDIKMASAGATVLTGSNGTGKSTILRLVYAVSACDIATLVSAPVDSFTLSFSHIPPFGMRRVANGDHERIFEWGAYSDIVTSQVESDNLPEWANEALRENGFDVQYTAEHLIEYVNRSDVRPDEYRLVREAMSSMDIHDFHPRPPSWMSKLQDVFPAVFVTDQRLVIEPNKRRARHALSGHSAPAFRSVRRASTTTRAVEAAAKEIADQISRADSNYARTSQVIDRRFPSDMINAMQFDQAPSRKEVERLIREVDATREKLRLVGLLDSDNEYQPELGARELETESVRPVVAAILRSTLKKFEVLRRLAGRLTAFKEFLDNRFESKSISLTRSSGLAVVLQNGKILRPAQLSSGEQQMIVLAFEILFKTQPGTLVIIDEPEISLHVLWQDSLLKDLALMGRSSQLQFMMATHSPAILGDFPELERSLDGLAARRSESS